MKEEQILMKGDGFYKPKVIDESVVGVAITKITVDPGKDDDVAKVTFTLKIDGNETTGKVEVPIASLLVSGIIVDAVTLTENKYGIREC